MDPIMFYTRAKNWEDPCSRFGDKVKKYHTDGKNDGQKDRGNFIGPKLCIP